MENYLRMIFGRDYGYAYQYQGTADDVVEITVGFCTACDNHLLDTTVSKMNETTWIIWSNYLLENNSDFRFIAELHPPVIEIEPEPEDPTPNNPGQ